MHLNKATSKLAGISCRCGGNWFKANEGDYNADRGRVVSWLGTLLRLTGSCDLLDQWSCILLLLVGRMAAMFAMWNSCIQKLLCRHAFLRVIGLGGAGLGSNCDCGCSAELAFAEDGSVHTFLSFLVNGLMLETLISTTLIDYFGQMSVKNCFIRGSVVRYVLLPKDGVDVDILHDATRREAKGAS